MTLKSRKTVRDAIVTDLKAVTLAGVAVLATEAGGQAHVFDHLEKEPGGISPFACVDGGSVLYDLSGDDSNPTAYGLIVGFWVRRDLGEAASEDVLDDLALELAKLLRKSYNAKFSTPSVSDYEVIDGLPYKFELHFVELYE
jgi:hypothetical protein